jgi:hypothetical protein
MEEQAKKPVHITWQEAVRVEAEQDKARQARCRSMPPSRMKLITDDVSGDLAKLKASALRLWDVNFNQRLRMWTETAGVNSRTAKNRHEAQAEECQRGQFGDLVVGFKESSAIYFKRGPTKSAMASAMAIVLGIILLAGAGTMPYWQRSKNYLSHLTVKWGTIAQQDPGHTSEPEVRVEGPKVQSATPQLSSTNHEPVQPDGREITAKRAPAYLGNFEVVDNSFVRDKPAANATIITTLRPGTQVMVESKTGEYLHIRSLNDARVIGYVHEEDAFFQAH